MFHGSCILWATIDWNAHGSQVHTDPPESSRSRPTAMSRFPPVDVDLQLIILAGELVIVDRSCDAFDPVYAVGERQIYF